MKRVFVCAIMALFVLAMLRAPTIYAANWIRRGNSQPASGYKITFDILYRNEKNAKRCNDYIDAVSHYYGLAWIHAVPF